MKKLVVLALSALLVVAFTLPASALEAQFGGYWRTRFYTNQNFTGEDQTEAKDFSKVDTRSRLYLTAVFHENLKFVNKFEFDATWGQGDSYGDIGADGVNLEIKNSYADFNLGPVNFKVGVLGYALGSSFLMDTDISGALVSYMGENLTIPFFWFKAWEGGNGRDANDLDVDIVGLNPEFTFGSFGINPFVAYFYSDNSSEFVDNYGVLGDIGSPVNIAATDLDELNLWYGGLTLEFDKDPLWIWATGIYQGGDVELVGGDTIDFEGYLAALGFDVDLGGKFGVHGRTFYASGDDGEDPDFEAYFVPAAIESYYWSEIMGYGVFDSQVSNNSPGDQISNIWAGNLGISVKPMEKLTISLDGWYALLAEEDGNGEDYLGTEVDLRITYQLVSGLNLDVVGAYLFAGEATTENSNDEEDPYEVGAQLSLSF